LDLVDVMEVRGRGADGQSVGAFQVGGQAIGRDHQGDRKQNTKKFHVVTFAFSKICEIGMPPFLLSVFG